MGECEATRPTKQSVEDTVRERVKTHLDLDKLPELRQKLVDDLGADSLALIELVINAEEIWEIDIPDEDVGVIEARTDWHEITVQDLVDYLCKKLEAA